MFSQFEETKTALEETEKDPAQMRIAMGLAGSRHGADFSFPIFCDNLGSPEYKHLEAT